MQIQLVQIFIQLMCSLVLYLIAIKLFNRRIIGLFVMACYLFHPTLILSSSYILTETLYGFFNLLFIYLLVHSVNGYLIIGFFVMLIPWWIRNVISLNKIVLLAE
jgi:Gpi18-like mannosyltransferase